MAFYRFTRACRQVIINYLQGRLGKSEKHWDGSDWVEIPETRVIDAAAYDPRRLPVVVTDTAVGNIRTLSFNHVISPWQDMYGLYGPRNAAYQVFGGRGDFDITIYCAANDRELQQKIVDVTTVYLTIGRGWLWYYRHVLLGDVRIAGDGVEGDTQQERVWYANLVVPVTADWRLLVPSDQIQKVNIDVDLVTPDDPFEDPRNPSPGILTPLDPEEARDKLLELKARAQAYSSPNSTEDLKMEREGVALPLRPMQGSFKREDGDESSERPPRSV